MQGYIKAYRQIMLWDWYNDSHTFHLFMHILFKASTIERVYNGIPLKRGQLITSRLQLSSQTGMSEQKIRTCLKKIKESRAIQVKATSKYTIITVKNWDRFQLLNDEQQPANNQIATNNQPSDNQVITSQPPADNQQSTTVKECKKEECIEEKDNLKVIQKEKTKKACRFKAERDFSTKAIIPNDFLDYATKNGFSAYEATEHFQNFADYWEGVPGAKGLKLDWLATWRNWLRRSVDFAPKQGSPQRQQKSKFEAIQEFTEQVRADPRSHVRPKSKYAYLLEGD